MIGFRGAARYAHPSYADGFALECAALKRVREVMGLTNLKIMVPFCRREEEARRVLGAMAGHGLKRGEGGLEVFVMCEIPNNVIRIDAFADRLKHPELDAVMHELGEVAAAGAASVHVSAGRGQLPQHRLHQRDTRPVAAHHEAGPVARAIDAAACANIDEMNAGGRETAMAADRIAPV